MVEAVINGVAITADLIQDCIAGRRSSQEQLYRTFSPKMYAICLRYSENAASAQDILQDGFIKLFNNLDKYRGEGSFEGWVKRIFINTAIEHYRRSANTGRYLEISSAFHIQGSDSDGFRKMSHADLLDMVRKLPTGYRTVFNLYAIEGYSHKEIGEMLNISTGTSKSQLARARAMLQKMVKKYQ